MAHGLSAQIVDLIGSTTITSDKEYTRTADFAIGQCNTHIFIYVYRCVYINIYIYVYFQVHIYIFFMNAILGSSAYSSFVLRSGF